jgi:hypothetical protein
MAYTQMMIGRQHITVECETDSNFILLKVEDDQAEHGHQLEVLVFNAKQARQVATALIRAADEKEGK